MYDIELFIRIINFIVCHNDEPELYLDLQNGTRVEFICYKDFIDAYIGEVHYKFADITDFVDNLIVDGKTLRECWQDIIYIDNDGTIDYCKEPQEQFDCIVNGHICYKVLE